VPAASFSVIKLQSKSYSFPSLQAKLAPQAQVQSSTEVLGVPATSIQQLLQLANPQQQKETAVDTQATKTLEKTPDAIFQRLGDPV
jgi:hypothetical protein